MVERKKHPPANDLLRRRAIALAELLEEKKGEDVLVLALAGHSVIADYFVIASSRSKPHTQALADAVLKRMKEDGIRPRGDEGYREGSWILLDYADIVVHLFTPPEREHYNLERLWSHVPFIYPPDL